MIFVPVPGILARLPTFIGSVTGGGSSAMAHDLFGAESIVRKQNGADVKN